MENNDMQIDQETFLSILKEHQLWLDSHGQSGKRADLSGQDFSGISFRYDAYLPSASPWSVNLKCASLKKINFSNADLSEANFEAANLIEGDLNGANFKRANLKMAKMINAHLRGANLRGADLRNADLTGADLTGANLTGAELRGANLTRANLIETDLTGTDLQGANVYEANLDEAVTDFLLPPQGFIQSIAPIHFSADNWGRKLQSLEIIAQSLEAKLNQAESKTVKDEEEIKDLKKQLKQAEDNLNKRKEKLKGRIREAQQSLSEALKNTDKQIKNNEASASCFGGLGMGLFSFAIVLLIFFSIAVLFHPEYISEKKLNILFYTFPIITLMVIGTTCLRHQKNLLAEVRHFSNMKHQIELYSGLLEASQHAAVSFDNPDEYVQETFTQIRNRLLNSQYLPDHSSSDNQPDNDFGSDKVIDLLSKIADLSGKKSI
ncbi:pentapeptide repeat-containing protein [butyrate-producing bacterium]|nr:pentapeptide repeat-containing protein [butyrate-producing bacterium]